LEVRAELVVGADGRSSTVRQQAGLRVKALSAPMDVLWMRISRRDSDPELLQGRFDRGRILVMLYRGDYWQIGFVIPKGGIEEVHRRGCWRRSAPRWQPSPRYWRTASAN
jgi:2-polyprenyl-6-methoxyphenol hydroxylase-like FAD-dependent oxidoreductase